MKTITTLHIALLLALSQVSYSQPTNMTYTNKCDSLRNEGNLKEAIIEYGKLHSQNPKEKINDKNTACPASFYSLK
jgi:hypothetical protein